MDINPIDNPELFTEESRAELLFVVLSILMAVATGVVGLRFYTRAVVLGLIGLDDWLCLVSLVMILTLGSLALVLVTKGLGRHVGTLPQPDGFHDYLKTFYVMIIFYNLAIASFKLCFLAQYYRIINSKTMRTLIFAATGFVGLWTMSQVCLNIFQCAPVSGFWEPGPGVKCLPIVPGWYIAAAGNILADILIILIPLPVIKGLNLPRAQKLALAGIFCLGFLTTAISLIRVKYLPQGIDTTWDNVDTTFWSMAEAVTGIICVTLPTLRPLAIRWFPGVFLAISRATGSSNKNTNRSRPAGGGGGGAGGGGGGSRHWQPKDLEGSQDSGCGLRSAARRVNKQWSNLDDQDETTLVTRTHATTSVSRDDKEAGAEPAADHSYRQSRHRSQSYSHGHGGAKATWSQTRSQTRSLTWRSTTFLDAASDEGVEIELHDVPTKTKDRNAPVAYPMATYGNGNGSNNNNDDGGRRIQTGHAVEISGGRAGAAASREDKQNPFIRVQHEVDIKGTAL